jgi:FMN-dependent NADH-azoreductase
LKTLLVINSSVSGANSASRVLVEHAVAEFAKANPAPASFAVTLAKRRFRI